MDPRIKIHPVEKVAFRNRIKSMAAKTACKCAIAVPTSRCGGSRPICKHPALFCRVRHGGHWWTHHRAQAAQGPPGRRTSRNTRRDCRVLTASLLSKEGNQWLSLLTLPVPSSNSQARELTCEIQFQPENRPSAAKFQAACRLGT
jgi:hypothetical protein